MENREIYAATVSRYIDQLHIDFFAVPVKFGREIYACLFPAHRMVEIVASDSKLIEYGKNENFPRWNRVLTATTVLPEIRPMYKFPMGIDDIKSVKAQEWELIIHSHIGGEYTGQDLHNVDIIHPIYGRIEIKKGRGKIGEYA